MRHLLQTPPERVHAPGRPRVEAEGASGQAEPGGLVDRPGADMDHKAHAGARGESARHPRCVASHVCWLLGNLWSVHDLAANLHSSTCLLAGSYLKLAPP